MERAGLISLTQQNGRPYGIRAAKPIYRTAFNHMLSDTRLTALMGVLTTKQLIQDEEDRIRRYEEEMARLEKVLRGGVRE
ncbi:hypothetical protein HK097_005034, partial [Rhizophlyctis rosea]